MTADRARLTKLIAAFGALYFVWGSSYLAMKIGTRELAPATFVGVRFVLAAALLFAVAWLRGARLPTHAVEWRHVFLMGALTVTISSGLNNWAIQYVPSNQSALINATSAFWIAGFGTLGPRGHSISSRAKVGLVLGFIGAALIVWPRGGVSFAALGPQLTIIIACIAWAVATVYYRSVEVETEPVMFTALQMFAGGAMLLLFGLATGTLGEWQWSWGGVGSMLYLAIFSSCVCYTAYGWLMVNTTPDKLSTYCYVNPAVAAMFGWLLLGEVLSPAQLLGMAIILLGVGLVTVRPEVISRLFRTAS